MKYKPITAVVATMALGAFFAQGAVLIDFTMEEHIGDPSTNNLTFDTNGSPQNTLSATSTLVAGLSNPNAYGRGTFGTGGGGTQSGEINWAAWSSNTEFLVVEFTVGAGSTVTLSDLTMDVSRNGGGAPTNFYTVVLPGTGLSGANLGAGTHLDVQTPGISGNAGGSVGHTMSWDLSSVGPLAAGSYTIGWGTQNGANGNMRVSDIVVNGTITTVPEPSSTVLLGTLGFLGLLRRRRH